MERLLHILIVINSRQPELHLCQKLMKVAYIYYASEVGI